MRITQSSMVRNYMTNLRSSISNLAKSNEKLSSFSKYKRASENTSDTARAFVIREQLYKNEQFLSNIEDTEGELSSAESNLSTINSLLQTVEERALRGVNGTMEATDRKVIAQEITNMKEQILQSINSKFGSRYVFGNSNNSEAPFAYNADGALTFNKIRVSDMLKDPTTGKLMYPNPDYDPAIVDSPVNLPVPENKDIYVDIGLGITVSGKSVDPKTALKVSTSGIDALGFGEDNVYDLLTKISGDFAANRMENMSENLEKLSAARDNVMLHVSDIGSRTSYIAQISDRLENENVNLLERQDSLEIIDVEFEAINNKSFETAWLINLQLGSQIIPPSIFDFMK